MAAVVTQRTVHPSSRYPPADRLSPSAAPVRERPLRLPGIA